MWIGWGNSKMNKLIGYYNLLQVINVVIRYERMRKAFIRELDRREELKESQEKTTHFDEQHLASNAHHQFSQQFQ